MKVLIWHGYLLGGTGSNVYTRALARAWARLGHEVVVFCQEPHPEDYDLGGATVVRPPLDGPLPVFVLDRYEDMEARYLQDFTAAEREHFVERNAAAVREHLPADFLLTNHVLLGAPVGAAAGMPFTVKAHGSELEFSMRGNEELCAWARESLAAAAEVDRRAPSTSAPSSQRSSGWTERVRVVPPGVDVEEFRPEPRDEALAGLLEEAGRDSAPASERDPDAGNAERFGDVPRRGGADRRLRREAQRREGRAPAPRRARSTSTREPSSSASGRRAKSWSGPRANACSSPAPSSTATSAISGRSLTSASRRPSSRRPSAWSPPRRQRVARRRSSRAIRGLPRSPKGSRRPIRRSIERWLRSSLETSPTWPRSSTRSSRFPAQSGLGCRQPPAQPRSSGGAGRRLPL